jgi:hypothetical protein
MGSSRESSPDWLRNFQGPTQVAVELSSDSEPHSAKKDDNNGDDDRDSLSPNTKPQDDNKVLRKRKRAGDGCSKSSKKDTPKKPIGRHVKSDSLFTLSSDSESCSDTAPIGTLTKSQKKKGKTEDEAPVSKTKLDSRVNEDTGIDEDPDEEIPVVKNNVAKVSSSRVPLLVSDKVQRTKALVECEGDMIDLSGDVGAVGRVVISDNNDMMLDLKGTIYRTTILPSRTFCVVNFAQSEAKIEAIMNDFIQLKAESNVYDAETMVEGTLEGFSFDSEDEADRLPNKSNTNQTEQNEGDDKKPVAKKRKVTTTAKAGKKVKKKSKAPKKTKAKK